MNRRVIKRINQKYLDKIVAEEKRHQHRGTNHFQHIARNLLNGMYLLDDHDLSWSEVRETYVDRLTELKTYLRLIKTYPEFRQSETTSIQGHYPGVLLTDYVSHAKRELENKRTLACA